MIDFNKLQILQKGLDDFIINNKGLHLREQSPDFINNIWCAGFSELHEIENALDDPEEWIDFLHFLLSVANKLDIKITGRKIFKSEYKLETLGQARYSLLTSWTKAMDASKTYKHWSNKSADFETLVFEIENMADILIQVFDFVFDLDMQEEYMKKWEINRKRQINHY